MKHQAEIEMMTNANNIPVYVVKFYQDDKVVDTQTFGSYTAAEDATRKWYLHNSN